MQEISKAVLIERREERALVGQAKNILEEQRDLLAHRMIDLIKRLEAIEQELDERITAARTAVRRAILRHGSNGIRGFARGQTELPDVQWSPRRILGSVWLEPPSQLGGVRAPELGDGWEVSVEVERATMAFHRLLRMAAELAPVYNNLERLTDAFARTQRRVSALEHIILPDLEGSIKEIERVLDEADRENLVRAHLAKD
jgi:V/A-type H+-transporting ATPase subunit D